MYLGQLIFRALIVCLCVPWIAAQAQPLTITYARDLPTDDGRLEYPLRMLELAMHKSGTRYQLRPSERPLPQGAAMHRIVSGKGVSLMWSMTSLERETQLHPIRIPLDKGLFGYRIALLRAQHKDMLAGVKQLEDLAAYTAGQGHDWPDVAILQSNGLQVLTGNTREALFSMLEGGRFDYFPRSVLEISKELEGGSHPQLVMDEHLLLHYPAAIYFFVRKGDTALARALESGLQKALADGSFDMLFYEYFGDTIKHTRLKDRTLLKLNNPALPPATPLADKRLWLNLKDAGK